MLSQTQGAQEFPLVLNPSSFIISTSHSQPFLTSQSMPKFLLVFVYLILLSTMEKHPHMSMPKQLDVQ